MRVPTDDVPALMFGRPAARSFDQVVRVATWLRESIPRFQSLAQGEAKTLAAEVALEWVPPGSSGAAQWPMM